jgi:hypothetical protein
MYGLKRLAAVSIVALAGCGGSSTNNVHATLVLVVSEPAGSHCATGGQAIEVGLDANDNNVLDASEITSTSYVCNGAVGATGPTGPTGPVGPASDRQPVVATAPEPAGAHCPSGGIALSVGYDLNNNGLLDASEVTGTTYVCNGTSGGKASLLSVTVEPAGTNCPTGGIKVQSGVDTNGDGTLGSGEVTSTDYVCNGNGTCKADGLACSAASECCTGACTSSVCGGGTCKADGTSCTAAAQCCTGSCTNSVCGGGTCKASGTSCTAAAQCCSGSCNNSVCGATCLADGTACASSFECCGNDCVNGVCGGTCNAVGYYCNSDLDCCSNACGAGICSGALPDGGAPTCRMDGRVCSTDSQCCDLNCVNSICGGTAFTDGGNCYAAGDTCSYDMDCCSGFCVSGACGACVASGHACDFDSDCCNNTCIAGSCANDTDAG